MKFNINIGKELRCSDCKYYKPFDNRYGTCTYKMENELDRLGMHQRSRKICHDFKSFDDKTVKQILLSDFGAEIITELEHELQTSVLGVSVGKDIELVQKERVPILVSQVIKKVVSRET